MNALFCVLTLVGALTGPSSPNFNIPAEKYVLPSNGLEVILSPDHRLPIVAVNIWYHAGPLNEPPQRTGFAHLFEHLMFQGSKNVGDDLHFKWLEAAGGSQINASTSHDYTNYFATVPANELALALWLESDRMGFLLDTLTLEKLNKQREVVMNERRQSRENAPYGPSFEALPQTLFPPGHPYYGNIIGSMQDLTNATLDDVRAFFTNYYAPANATLVVAGDFAPAAAKLLIEQYFGSLPARPRPHVTLPPTPPITQEKRVTIEEPVRLAAVQMGWLSPPAYQPGDAECDILAMVLGSGKSSRLYQRLVYELQIAQEVAVAQMSLALQSMFIIRILARPGVEPAHLEQEINKELARLFNSPPTEREIERARNTLLTHHTLALQNLGGSYGRADMLNRYNQYIGQPDWFAPDLARYANITPAAVQQLAQTLLHPDHRVVITTVPKS